MLVLFNLVLISIKEYIRQRVFMLLVGYLRGNLLFISIHLGIPNNKLLSCKLFYHFDSISYTILHVNLL